MRTNSATERNDASQTQPIAVAYFNRTTPVVIDHYLHREESVGFVLVMVSATLIAAGLLVAFG